MRDTRTVAELIEELSQLPQDATIYVYGSEGAYYGSDYISVYYQEEKGRVVICSN